MLQRFFSYVLLFIYSTAIVQDGVEEGMHTLAHATEIFSQQFSFHQHGHGHFHVHHQHGFIDTFRQILNHSDEMPDSKNNQVLVKEDAKWHIGSSIDLIVHQKPTLKAVFSEYPFGISSLAKEVVLPPPK